MKFLSSNSHVQFLQTSTILLLGLSLPCADVWAQPEEKPSSGGFVGIGLMHAPKYQGSDQSSNAAQPIGEYHWANGLYVGGESGLVGMQMNLTRELQMGVALGVDGGRKESDSNQLTGMGDIAAKGTFNIYTNYVLTEELALNGGLQLGLGTAGQGGLLKLGTSYSMSMGSSTQLSLNLGATVANASYMQDYFGVTANQATASGYRTYAPKAGLRDVSVGLGLNIQINKNWLFTGGIASTHLSNIAQDSPLVRKATSQSAFTALAYRF